MVPGSSSPTDTEPATQVGDPSAEGRPRPAGRRAEAREQAILDAALELLVEVGYDRLSMDALAERAHASKATIYRHWSGKAEVVAEAMRSRAHGLPETPDLGDLRRDLLAVLDVSCEVVAQEGPLVAAVLWAMRSDPVLAELIRADILEEKRARIEAVVQQATARGDEIRGDAALVTDVISAMVFQRMLFTEAPLDEEFRLRLVDEVVIPLLQHASPSIG